MEMTRKFTIIGVMVLLILLLGMFVAPGMAGGPHNRATGTVTWTARTNRPPAEQIPGIVSSFDVHDNAPGAESDRGTHDLWRPSGPEFEEGAISLDVKCVNVGDTQAWFAGTVESASGGYAGLEGEVFLYWVHDVSTPGAVGPDEIGGRGYSTLQAACNVVDVGGWTGTGKVTDGNLKVFYWEE